MSGSEARKHPASARKLRQQREKGSVPSSTLSAGFVATAAGVALILGTGPLIWAKLQALVVAMPVLTGQPFDTSAPAFGVLTLRVLGLTLAPLVGLVLAVSVLVSILYNKGFNFTLHPIAPKAERISPSAGFKRIYGTRGWIETGAALLRLTVWLGWVAFCAVIWLPGLIRAPDCVGLCHAGQITPLVWMVGLGAIAILVLFAAADARMQRTLFLGEQRMTNTEVKREQKDQAPPNALRRERRRRQQEAQKPQAPTGPDLANMFFFSPAGVVAIRFVPRQDKLPRIMAKARTGPQDTQLRATLTARALPSHPSAAIVNFGLSNDLGAHLLAEQFAEFAAALHAMFPPGTNRA